MVLSDFCTVSYSVCKLPRELSQKMIFVVLKVLYDF